MSRSPHPSIPTTLHTHFATYLSWETDQLLGRLGIVAEEIANLIVEEAASKAEEARAKSQAFLDSTETTITGRERVGSITALEYSLDAVDISARRQALDVERSYIEFLIVHRS